MSKDFYLDIISVNKHIFSGLVKRIQVIGSEGILGIYPGHAPLITTVIPGEIKILKQHNQEEIVHVFGGILEIKPYKVMILADMLFRD